MKPKVQRAAAIAAAALLVVVGAYKWRQTTYLRRLPPLPALTGQPAAVRAHLTEADRAARAQPTSSSLVGALGLAYHADMLYEQAERCYEIAQALSPSEWRWTYYHALAGEARGDLGGGIAELRRTVAAQPDFSPAWWRLGEAEFKAGHHDLAEEAWRRVVSLPEPTRPVLTSGAPRRETVAPLSAYATLGLARLALARRDAARARELLEDATAKAPRFGPAFRLLGSTYATLNRTQDAEKVVRIADRLPAYDPYVDPTFDTLVRESRSSTFLLQQAAAADLSTNAAWREHLIRRALEFDPDNTDAMYELAAVLRALRRYDEALVLLERHQRVAPGDFQVTADIGRCLSGLRRFPEAESVLRRALEGLDDANTRYDLGFVLDQTGRTSEAVVQYQQALERNPNHRDALNNLAVDLARQGKMDQAVQTLERLVRLDPGNAEAHTNLGALLLAQGARDRAAREFEQALQVNPDSTRARDGLRQIRR